MAWSGKAVSDSNGVFTLRGVRKGSVVHLAAGREDLHLTGRGAFRPAEEIVLRLTRYETTEVRGRVLDEERRPVSHAFIRLGYIGRENESSEESFSALTDASGVYRITGVRPFREYGITVEASGYRYRSLKLPVLKEKMNLADVVLLRTDRWITGTVVDPDGKAVEGATVEVTIGCCREVVEARTNEKGYFRLDGLIHLIEPQVIILHPTRGHNRCRYVPTNASHRFILIKTPPRLAVGETKDEYEKVKRERARIEGKPAPPLQVSRWLSGKPVTLEELLGKLVVLHFWSVSHESSVESLREAENLYRLFGKEGVEVIIVHPFTEDTERVRKVIREQGVTCRAVIDSPPEKTESHGKTFQAYGFGAFPFGGETVYNVLVNRKGLMNQTMYADDHSHSEPLMQNDVESKIRRLRKERD
jgi:hypothetical protein